MPFIEDNPGADVRTPGLRLDRQAAPEGSLLGAAFRQENVLVSAYNYMNERAGLTPEPDHNPLDMIQDTHYEAEHLDRFVGSRSRAETAAIMSRIDRETADRRILDAGGFAGFAAQAAAGIVDPTMFIPLGTIYRGARLGQAAVRTGLSTAAATGAVVAGQEAILYGTQETRTGLESTINIATGTILGGLLGGAVGFLSARELKGLHDVMDGFRRSLNEEIATGVPPVTGGPRAAGAGAEVRAGLNLQSALGAEKALHELSPVTRLQTSDFEASRAAIRDLGDGGLSYRENWDGVPTSEGGTVETRVKMRRAPLIEAIHQTDDAYARYWFDKQQVGFFGRQTAGVRAGWARLTGQDGGKLTAHEFREEVGKALRRGDKHPIKQVEEAAQAYRKQVFEALRDDAVLLDLLPENVKVLGAQSYLTRVYNRERIKSKRDVWTRILLRHFTEQRTTAAAKFEAVQAAKIKTLETELADIRTPASARASLEAQLQKELEQLHESNPAFVALDKQLKELRERAAGKVTDTQIAEIRNQIARINQAVDEGRVTVAPRETIEPAPTDFDVAGMPRRGTDSLERELAELSERMRQGAGRFDEIEQELAGVMGRLQTDFAAQERAARAEGGPEYRAFVRRRNEITQRLQRLRSQTPADEAPGAAATFRTAKGSTYEVHADGTTTRNKAPRPEHPGPKERGPQPRSEATYYIEAGQEGRLALTQGGSPRVVDHGDGTLSMVVRNPDGRWGVSPESSKVPVSKTPSIGAIPIELWKRETVNGLPGYSRVHFGNPITEVGPVAARPGRPERIAAFDAASEAEIAKARQPLDDMLASLAHTRDRVLAESQARFDAEYPTAKRGQKAKRRQAFRDEQERIVNEHDIAVRRAERNLRPEIRRVEKEQAKARRKLLAELTGAERSAARATDIETRIAREKAKEGPDLVKISAEELPDLVNDVTNTILGTSILRLPGIDLLRGPKGPLRRRVLNIPDEAIEEFLESDVEKVARIYTHSMASDIELAAKFGDVNMKEQLTRLREELDAKVAAVPEGRGGDKLRRQLHRQFENDVRDITALRDRIRGNYRQPEDPEAIAYRAAKMALNLNYIARGGAFLWSSVSDAARPIMRYGINAFRDGWIPLIADLNAVKLSAREVRLAGTALDMVRDQRALEMADVLDDFGRNTKFERGVQAVSDRFSMLNMMSPWNGGMKSLTGVIAIAEVLRGVKAIAAGKGTKKQLSIIHSAMDADTAKRVWAHVEQSGEQRGRVLLPNTEDWRLPNGLPDTKAIEAFRAVVNREVDNLIVTPGIERPLGLPSLISEPVWRMISQFKAFSFTSTSRVTLAGLQQRDAAALSGVIAAMALGALASKVKAQLRNEDTSTWNHAKWIQESLDNSGLLGILMEANNISEKVTGGSIGLSRFSGKQVSRYASRNIVGSVLGPTADGVTDLLTLGRLWGPLTGGEGRWGRADTHAIRKVVPLQNLFYVRWLFDQAEESANNYFGLPERRPRRVN